MSNASVLVGCWYRRMSGDCGDPSADAFLKRVGSEYPQPCVREGKRQLCQRDQDKVGLNGWSFRLEAEQP
jgi:hypothetical protein